MFSLTLLESRKRRTGANETNEDGVCKFFYQLPAQTLLFWEEEKKLLFPSSSLLLFPREISLVER